MDADSEAAFLGRGRDTAAALWPGRVKIKGVTYEGPGVSVVHEPHRVYVAGGDEAGTHHVRGLLVEISKELMPVEPELDLVVEDMADGELYRIYEVEGKNPPDGEWYLKCGKHKE